MASVPLLSARGLNKSFGGRQVLDGLDLELADGMRVGVLGPNGGGKSTLLAILAGLEEPDDGTVTRRRALVHAFLPQHVPGDQRTPLAWVRAARPDRRARRARRRPDRGAERRPAQARRARRLPGPAAAGADARRARSTPGH